MRPVNLPDLEPARQIERHVWRRTFFDSLKVVVIWLARDGVKASMEASNFAAMSINEVIVWGGVGLLTVD